MVFEEQKILIVVASLILLGFIYKAYCDHFWKNYNEAHFVYGEYDETDEITDFSFTAYPPIPPDTILSKKNFWKYEWRRKLIEPYHGQWINDLKLSFINDSTIFERITGQYISENYWTYPLTRKFRCNINSTYTFQYDLDKQSMSFVTNKQDTVKIVIGEKNIIIKHVFM